MSDADKQLEAFLREFEPRRPQALPRLIATPDLRRRLVVAAVVALACGLSVWLAMRETTIRMARSVSGITGGQSKQDSSSGRPSLLRLTKLAQEDPEQFDGVLDVASRRALPTFQGKDSSLSILAKE